MEEKQFKPGIASHLKEIRKQRQLSLDAVAKLTGVSKAMLGQIEREESSPTIDKLWQIASGLDTSFSAFFGQTPAPGDDQHFPNDPNMQVKSIVPYSPSVNYEIHEITLTNHHCQMSGPHAHGVIETIIVHEGEMEVLSSGCWEKIAKGDRLRLYADQTHGYKAVTETVVFQNIVSY
ncbi:helix-turn-helix domain-containing protein [Vibrio sp. YIC-376]|uniref:helix-turn-helix domain-containing protein n=1 Tax=Vibrio sp. YIC-376 TaxID=3136162 RepID=UPI00402A89A9